MTTAVKAGANGKTPAAAVEADIIIPSIRREKMAVTLVGDSALISHKWSDKAKKEMLDKQMQKAKTAKAAKDPDRDYRESLYEHPDGGYGFPCVAFKAAAVSACRFTDGLKMTEARGAFHVDGELAKIEGEPRKREDMVRVGMGTADIRYRGEFPVENGGTWRTTLTVTYNADKISPSQIFNLFNLAGFGVGVGEWRPEKDGSYGRFHVATDGE